MTDRAARIARAHSVLGLFPLTVFVVLHLVQAYSAFDGRVAWIAAMVDGAPGMGVGVGLLLALALHAALGVRRLRERSAAGEPAAIRGLARVQLVTGIVAVAFVAFHVWQLWPEAPGPHVDRARSYDRLSETLGRWPQLLAYVVGITALSFHLGHGLSRLPFTWGLQPRPARILFARLFGGVVGLWLWLAALHVVGYFATGDGLWPQAPTAVPAKVG